MPPKKTCPTSVAELPEAARQAKTYTELRSALVGMGCSATQVKTLFQQMGGASATPAKKRKADEAELEAPSAKKATAAPKTTTKKATPKRTAAKTPRSAPRKSIAKSPSPKKASPKTPTPKKASPKAPTPKSKTPTPKRASPKAPTPKKAPSPKMSPEVHTAAFGLACIQGGVDWSKCLKDRKHAEKCAKPLREEFPDIFDCPTCPKKHSSAEAAKGTAGAPPPPPPPPPPMPKKTLVAIKDVTKDFTGASSLVSDKKGIIGMMSGVTLKKVDPAAPRPAFQPIPVVAADGSITEMLANAPNASAAERAKLGQVAEATDLMAAILAKQGKLNKVQPMEKAPPVSTGPRASMFAEMASKAGTLKKTAGPAKSAYKEDPFAGNPLMALLSKRIGNIRTALNE